jgi:hypothetical protein
MVPGTVSPDLSDDSVRHNNWIHFRVPAAGCATQLAVWALFVKYRARPAWTFFGSDDGGGKTGVLRSFIAYRSICRSTTLWSSIACDSARYSV